MRRNFVRDDTITDIFRVGQTEVLLGCHVTEHTRTMPSTDRRTDRGRDVVISRSDIGDQRAEDVKRRFVTILLFQLHVAFDLVHRYVTRSFDHHLYIFLPRFERQFAQHFQLAQLRRIARIIETSGAQTVAE
ncbi:hypothetical protein D3C81_1706570 [compost metagenome]